MCVTEAVIAMNNASLDLRAANAPASNPAPARAQRNGGAHFAFLARFLANSATGYVAGGDSPTVVSVTVATPCLAAASGALAQARRLPRAPPLGAQRDH